MHRNFPPNFLYSKFFYGGDTLLYKSLQVGHQGPASARDLPLRQQASRTISCFGKESTRFLVRDGAFGLPKACVEVLRPAGARTTLD